MDVVRDVLHDDWSARDVELYLADYALLALRPMPARPHPPEPLPMHDGPTGRAFGAQEPYVEKRGDGRVRAHLPVTVRGDRLGVLRLTLPSAAHAEESLAELTELAEVLGHELVVAERTPTCTSGHVAPAD